MRIGRPVRIGVTSWHAGMAGHGVRADSTLPRDAPGNSSPTSGATHPPPSILSATDRALNRRVHGAGR